MLRHPGTWIVLTLLVIVSPCWSAGEPSRQVGTPAPPAAPAADDNAKLIQAAIDGDVATVRDLLDRGVKPDEPKDKYGNNPIQMATHNHHIFSGR